MANITLRAAKGSPLTNAEVDANFSGLNNELAGKAETSALSAVALSGAYADLSGKPTIPTVPTVVSAFTNDAGYITNSALTSYMPKVGGAFTGNVTIQNTAPALTLFNNSGDSRTYAIGMGLSTANGATSTDLQVFDYGTSTERLRIGANGVTIGRAVPQYTLDIRAASSNTLRVGSVSSDANGTIVSFDNGSGESRIWSQGAFPLVLGANSSGRFWIGTSGQLGVGGENYGSAGQVLTSQGSGAAPTWATPSGGISYSVRTANYTVADKQGVLANTSGGSFTVTLPASPTAGMQVFIADANDTWGTNPLTVARNGATIEGVAEDLVCDITGSSIQLVYTGTTWQVYASIGLPSGTAASLTGANVFTSGLNRVQATSAAWQFWKDGTPTLAGRIGFNTQVADAMSVDVFNGTSWRSFISANAAGNVTIPAPASGTALDVTGSVAQNVVSVAASNIDCSAGNYFIKTATSTLTWTVSNVPTNRAYSFILELTNGGTGPQNWFTGIKWPGGTAPTLTTSGVDVLGFITDDGGTTWRGVQLMKDSK